MYVSMHIKGMIQDKKTSESLAFQEYQDVQDMACQGKQGERGHLKCTHTPTRHITVMGSHNNHTLLWYSLHIQAIVSVLHGLMVLVWFDTVHKVCLG